MPGPALLPYGRTPSTADNTRDLGTATARWKRLYLGTSLVLQGASFATTLGFAAPSAARTITFPNASGTVALSGADAAFSVAQSTTIDDALSTAVTRGLTLSHTTSNTAQAGVGAGLLLRAESGAGTLRSAGAVDAIHTDVTDGAEVSALVLGSGIAGSILEVARFATVASAVNGFVFTGAATGTPPTLSVRGSDTDITLALSGKGAGAVTLAAEGSDNALSLDATGIKVDSGTDVTGTPTVSRNSGIVQVASGGATVSVTNTLCTVNSKIFAQIRNQTTNPVSILSVEPGAGSFVVRLSGDPGASHADVAFFMVQPDA